MNRLKSIIHTGNRKIDRNTIIFNMGSATNCPSRKLGLCKVCNQCYALKAERLYKEVLPYRERQAEYWNKTDISVILDDFNNYIKSKRKKVEYFRYNESGDFDSTDDIWKLHCIAATLNKNFGIITYGYTARKDLLKKYLKNHTLQEFFIIKLSGYTMNGISSTCVIQKNEIIPENYVLCSGKNCMTACKLCTKHVNIAFRKH